MDDFETYSLKRGRDYDMSLCVICQNKRRKNDKVLQLSSVALQALKNAAELRKKKLGTEYSLAIAIVENEFKDTDKPTLVWHSNICRPNFTSQSVIDRLDDRPGCSMEIDTLVTEHPDEYSKRLLRSRSKPFDKSKCILCCDGEESGALHLVESYNADKILKQAARADFELLARLQSAYDAMAGDFLYHRDCIRTVRQPPPDNDGPMKTDMETTYGHILEQVCRELRLKIESGAAVLLEDCWCRYTVLCKSVNIATRYNARRAFFKAELLKRLSDCIEIIPRKENNNQEGYIIIPCKLPVTDKAALVSDEDTDECFTMPSYNEDDMLSMVHVAFQLRRDILELSKNTKTQLTDENCMACVPDSLYMFLTLLLGGQDLLDGFDHEEPVAITRKRNVLSLGQDILYTVTNGTNIPPKQYGLAMTIHQQTRSAEIINLLHKAQQCMSYDQVLAADTALAEKTLENLDIVTGAIVPKNLVKGKPITQGLDNIDVAKESSKAGNTGYHGMQHVVYQEGTDRQNVIEDEMKFSYATLEVPDILCTVQKVKVAILKDPPKECISHITLDQYITDKTIEDVPQAIDVAFHMSRSIKASSERISSRLCNWTAMNQTFHKNVDVTKTEIGHMPLLNAPADNYDTLNTKFVQGLHIADTLENHYDVFVVDQALFCKAMELKWSVPEFRDRIIIRLGGLHTSMCFLNTIGNYVAQTGLKDVWIKAGVIGPLKADKILKGKSYKAAMRLHKMTWQALWRVLIPQIMEFCKTFDQVLFEDLQTVSTDENLDNLISRCKSSEMKNMMHKFIEDNKQDNKNFAMWWGYLRMVEILLIFTRGQRSGDWDLTQHSFKCMLPYFFRYDHTNYARWGTVYVAEMARLPDTVLKDLREGNFGVRWSEKAFTSVDEDHATEWVNGIGKGAGGISGITQTRTALLRFAVSYNDRSNISVHTKSWYGVSPVQQYSAIPSQLKEEDGYEQKLYDEFVACGVFNRDVHPNVLFNITTKDLATVKIEESLLSAAELGYSSLQQFVTQRLIVQAGQEKTSCQLSSRLPKVNALTFANLYDISSTKSKKADAAQVTTANRTILQRLVTAYDAKRPVDLAAVASHELMNVPIAIFETNGNIRSGNKSNLIRPLVGDLDYSPNHSRNASTIILDMMARVHSIGLPDGANTFGDLADIFIASVLTTGRDFGRIELVCDRYNVTSIKDCTRSKRSKSNAPCVRKAIDTRGVCLPSTKKDYECFLSSKENKMELQHFLATQILARAPNDKPIVVAGAFEDERDVKCNLSVECAHLFCNHEEADTRIVLHCVCSENDFILICTRDTDILVLLCAHQHRFRNKTVYMTLGNNLYLNIGALAENLGPHICESLPLCHALTGCDTVSYLYGIGKPTAYTKLQENPTMLHNISEMSNLDNVSLSIIEEFICKLYGNNICKKTDKLRETMLLSCSKPELMPPTSNAVLYHIQRAFYQFKIWACAHIAILEIPSPSVPGSGWRTQDGILQPILMDQEPIPKAIHEMISCQCSTGCNSMRCKCFKSGLHCTRLCHPKLEPGICENSV